MDTANYAFRFARDSTEKMKQFLYEQNIFIACSHF